MKLFLIIFIVDELIKLGLNVSAQTNDQDVRIALAFINYGGFVLEKDVRSLKLGFSKKHKLS